MRDRLKDELEAELAAADDYAFQIRKSVWDDMAAHAYEPDDAADAKICHQPTRKQKQ